MFKYANCIDANTRYCPCRLAEEGECVACGLLGGESTCNCANYSGTCIFQDFLIRAKKPAADRSYCSYRIMEKRSLRDDVFMMVIATDADFVKDLDEIGAFVFLKPPDTTDCNGVPISVMKADTIKNEITIAVRIVGYKTKLLSKCDDMLMVKGPFWNGVQGRWHLTSNLKQSVVVLGRGMAAAPAVLASKKIIEAGGKVFVYLEKGRYETSCLLPYYKEIGCTVANLSLMDKTGTLIQETMDKLESTIKTTEIHTILSAGSDRFHSAVIHYLHEFDDKLRFCTVNNATMCCGEGCCGSCNGMLGKRRIIKECKLQYNPLEYFSERQA